ncbi:hypothetical protein [Chryseobacterium tongliaoense]|uniref:hypothetical protein n=1 Tax=Chryseobacterium tongliaoense TaxID=3240933 RepID=UPI003513C3B3
MKIKILLIGSLFYTTIISAQIGVNTSLPSATLDVVGKPTIVTAVDGIIPPRLSGDQLQSKDGIYTMAQNGVLVYVTTPVTTITAKTIHVNTPGIYYYDAVGGVWMALNNNSQASGNGTAFYASADGAWSLINLGIPGTNWNKISLDSSNIITGVPSLFNNGVYTAPKSGLYQIMYEVQLEGGVDLSLLGGKSLGILKNGTTVFDRKIFDAVRVSLLNITLASIPVTSTTLNTMVKLNAGETLTFAIETGGVNLGLLTDGKVSVNIYKISD